MSEIKIVSVKPLDDYCLLLSFSNGSNKIFDVKPYIRGSWYGKLADQTYFRKVKLIRHGLGINWPEGQDIAPHDLFS